MAKGKKKTPTPSGGDKKSGKKRGRGRPEYAPTHAERKAVEYAVGYGMSLDEVCCLIINKDSGEPITRKTLSKHFAAEIATGKPRQKRNIISNVCRTAMSKSHPQAMRAATLYLTCQAGWQPRDQQHVQQEAKTADQSAAEVMAVLAAVDKTVGGIEAAEGRMEGQQNGHETNGYQNGGMTNGHEGNGDGIE